MYSCDEAYNCLCVIVAILWQRGKKSVDARTTTESRGKRSNKRIKIIIKINIYL